MKNWHPDSWSQQARELSDRIFRQVKVAIKHDRLKTSWTKYLGGGEYKFVTPEQWASEFFSQESWCYFKYENCRNPIYIYRAAKRYGRKLRQYKARHKAN